MIDERQDAAADSDDRSFDRSRRASGRPVRDPSIIATRAQVAEPVRVIREEPTEDGIPLVSHPEWSSRFPWLVHGVTGKGGDGPPFDLGLFGSDGGGEAVWSRWASLAERTGSPRVVHGAQVHGTAVRVHDAGPPGLHLSWKGDGHVTRSRGVLLAVSVADCVPVFLVHEARPAVCLLHAGWRGVAGGILGKAIATLAERLDVPAGELFFHAGPAICGRCYEVGPEVHEALGLPAPPAPEPVDLRRRLAEEAVDLGVEEARMTVSEHCTRCGPPLFFSHRGGDRERQVGFIGIKRRGAGAS